MSQQLYTTSELVAMSPEELRDAQSRGFVKPPAVVTVEPATPLTQPSPTAPPQAYAATSWASPYYDFVVPSGQRCQMQKLRPEMLIETDLLDKLTRLPAFAEENIRQAEGRPPAPVMPDKEQLKEVLKVVDELLPLVVVQPRVMPNDTKPEDRLPGSVLVQDVDVMDRIAILNRATQGVAMLDNFRKEA